MAGFQMTRQREGRGWTNLSKHLKGDASHPLTQPLMATLGEITQKIGNPAFRCPPCKQAWRQKGSQSMMCHECPGRGALVRAATWDFAWFPHAMHLVHNHHCGPSRTGRWLCPLWKGRHRKRVLSSRTVTSSREPLGQVQVAQLEKRRLTACRMDL